LLRRRERSARLQKTEKITKKNREDYRKNKKVIKEKKQKKFEAITEKSIMRLKSRQKSRHFADIKRQANRGLEGILREGRGCGTSPSLIKKINIYNFILTALKKIDEKHF